MPVSEWGVVLPAATENADLSAFISDIIASVGGALHPGGSTGIGEKNLAEFLAEAVAFGGWVEQGQLAPDGGVTAVMPLGSGTAPAYAALQAVRNKIDQFFAQCEAASLDERFVQRMGWQEAELQQLDFDDPSVIEEVLSKAPLAKANGERRLDLDASLNPYYAGSMDTFLTTVAQPVLGGVGRVLTALEWQQIKQFFAAHKGWVEARTGDRVAALGNEKLQSYLASDYPRQVRDLIAESRRAAVMLDGVRLVEKAILFQSSMMTFANNFISFPHLYDVNRRALFEMGTLVIDGRRFNMAVKVNNRGQHMSVAKTSGMYVLYVELTDEPKKEVAEVAVPVTSGTCGNLCVGKRGVFYDLNGQEKNARVVAIIDNPISFVEALSAPFKKMGRLLTGKIESWSSGADKKFESQTTSALANMKSSGGAKEGGAQPGAITAAGGMMMGGGVALAALGSAAAYITKTLSEINPWAILFGVFGALALVFLPLSVVAYMKLKKRDLSAILEGSGWGINARMRLTHTQGLFFTQRPGYPRGAKGVPSFVLRRILIGILVFLIVVCLVQFGRNQAKQNGPGVNLLKPSPTPVPAEVEASG